jgi:tetratricopeptide (TPR) repeat protein
MSENEGKSGPKARHEVWVVGADTFTPIACGVRPFLYMFCASRHFRRSGAKMNRILRRIAAAAALVAAAALSIGSATAASAVDRCISDKIDPDTSIEACTREINSGQYDYANLAILYVDRAESYVTKGNYDQALADLNQALRFNPRSADALSGRCNAYLYKGDTDHAMADCNQAIAIDPKNSDAYVSRGQLYIALGAFERATPDLQQAVALDAKNSDAYSARGFLYFDMGNFNAAAEDLLRANDLNDDAQSMLWRFLARQRLGQDGASELSANAARLKTKIWPYPVIDFYLGRRSQDEMRSAASTLEQKCQSDFFVVGEWLLLHNDAAGAKGSLQEAADFCPKGADEYAGAVAELKRIK